MSEKRPAEESASTAADAPPAKKQRLNSSVAKATDKKDSDIPMDIDQDVKSPEKDSKPSKDVIEPTEASKGKESAEINEGAEEEDIDIISNNKRIVFLTGNKGKLSEVQNFFNDPIKSLICNEKLDLDEIQGTPREIIKHKLLSAQKVLKSRGQNSSILVEDTSFILDAYSKIKDNNKNKNKNSESNGNNNNNNNNDSDDSKELVGMPGPYVKWLLKWDKDGNEGLCKMVRGLIKESDGKNDNDNKANAICIFGFLEKDSNECIFFQGICKGYVPDKPMNGENGFGWDPVFVPNGFDKSFAQMSVEDKNKISHRGIALIKFKQYLEKNYIKPNAGDSDNKNNNNGAVESKGTGGDDSKDKTKS